MALHTKCKTCFGGPKADFKCFQYCETRHFPVMDPFFLTSYHPLLLHSAKFGQHLLILKFCPLSNCWPSPVMTKTLSSLCWTYFSRINSICDQSNCQQRTPDPVVRGPLPVFPCAHRLIVLSILLQNPFFDIHMDHLLIQNESSMHGIIAVSMLILVPYYGGLFSLYVTMHQSRGVTVLWRFFLINSGFLKGVYLVKTKPCPGKISITSKS